MEEQNLYQNVKMQICRMIFEGTYKDGDTIPPERRLSEELAVSRVTIRKALKLLEEEAIIERVQGSGTRIALSYGARSGSMDIITLVAPAQNSFFSRFIDAFQTEADKHNSLILFKQKPRTMSLEKCLFQIYEKNLRNVVLWLEDMEISEEALKLLRGLGMNLVLFDAARDVDYADNICLDNMDAMDQLIRGLQARGCRKTAFVSWNETSIGGLKKRKESFQEHFPEHAIYEVPWTYHNRLEDLDPNLITSILEHFSHEGYDSIIYSVGELGIAFERIARKMGYDHQAGMIGDMPGAGDLGIITIEQDFEGMSAQIFECLETQNTSSSLWAAKSYYMKSKDR